MVGNITGFKTDEVFQRRMFYFLNRNTPPASGYGFESEPTLFSSNDSLNAEWKLFCSCFWGVFFNNMFLCHSHCIHMLYTVVLLAHIIMISICDPVPSWKIGKLCPNCNQLSIPPNKVQHETLKMVEVSHWVPGNQEQLD
jgi:hypothetical protein